MQDDDFNPCVMEAHDIFCNVSDYLLEMAATGQIDLNDIARLELLGRSTQKSFKRSGPVSALASQSSLLRRTIQFDCPDWSSSIQYASPRERNDGD